MAPDDSYGASELGLTERYDPGPGGARLSDGMRACEYRCCDCEGNEALFRRFGRGGTLSADSAWKVSPGLCPGCDFERDLELEP